MPEPCHGQDSGDVQMHNVRHSPHTPSNKTDSLRHVPVVHLSLLQTHCHLPEFAAWLSLPSATSVTLSYLIPWHFKTVYWLGASEILQKGCSDAVPALFWFSKTGQKRQAGPCGSALCNILGNTKCGGTPCGQRDRPSRTPHYTHTFLGYTKCSAQLSVHFLSPFSLVNPWRGRTQLTCLAGTAPPGPANLLLVPPTCLLRSPQGRGCFGLPVSFSINNCLFGGGAYVPICIC